MTHVSLCHNRRVGIRERRRDEQRERIASAATALFDERGYAAVTVDDVAEAADVTRRTVHRYFPQKVDLAFARAESTMDLVDVLVGGDSPPGPLGEQVVAGLRRLAEVWSFPRDEATAFARLVAGSEELQGRDLAKRKAVTSRLQDVLAERRPDADAMERRVWAAIAVDLFFLAFDAWLRDGDTLAVQMEVVLAAAARSGPFAVPSAGGERGSAG